MTNPLAPPRAPGPAPQWLIDFCNSTPTRERAEQPTVPIEVDPELAEMRAIDYLSHDCPPAYAGQRNDAGYRAACRLRDFGLDQPTTEGLMLQFWPCEPMLEHEELEHVVRSAYTYANGVQGADSIEAQFEPLAEPQEPTDDDLFIQPTENPWPEPAPIPSDAWAGSRLTPTCFIEDYLYADVAQLVAPGGTGKTTLALYMAAHVVLGWPVFGMTVAKPGNVVLLTAEDPFEQLVARLRRICEALALSSEEVERVQRGVRIIDVSGLSLRLTAVAGDVVVPSQHLKGLVDRLRPVAPVWLLVDPAISFGVGEARVNDAEQGLIVAARRIRNALGCAVEYLHHSGKANARAKTDDQYAGRGGSALADGSRMTRVLNNLEPDEWFEKTGDVLMPGEQGLKLARPKMSYCPPMGPIFIKRSGFAFASYDAVDSEVAMSRRGERVLEFMRECIAAGDVVSKTYLELKAKQLGLTRQEVREALEMLEAQRKIFSTGRGRSQKFVIFESEDEENG